MKCKDDKPLIRVSVRQIAEMICRSGDLEGGSFQTPERALEGTRIHQLLQKKRGDTYQKEVPLSFDVDYGEFVLRVEGRADGIEEIPQEDEDTFSPRWRIEEIKSTYEQKDKLSFSAHAEHRAQLLLYGWMLYQKQKEEKDEICYAMRLTYYQMAEEQEHHFDEAWMAADLGAFFRKVVDAYAEWVRFQLEHIERRTKCLKAAQFPFPQWREGQRAMCSLVYQTIRDEKGIFLQAPTGIGKTISALFPALKAMGSGFSSRIMYLTAKTAAASVAFEALKRMQKHLEGQHTEEKADESGSWEVLSIFLTARDRICPQTFDRCDRSSCPMALGYYDRINPAVWKLLHQEKTISADILLKYADTFQVCPYELAKECSVWCDVIVGDYNYAFDPGAALKNMIEDPQEKTVLLIDEAHNLPSRAQEMFSAAIRLSDVREVQKHLPKERRKRISAMRKTTVELARAMRGLFPEEIAEEDLEEWTSERDRSVRVFSVPSSNLTLLFERIKNQLGEFLMENADADDVLVDFYFYIAYLLRLTDEFDDSTVVYAEREEKDIAYHLYCVHPASRLRETYQNLRAAVFFSATMLPIDYYKEMLGGRQALKEGKEKASEDEEKTEEMNAVYLPSSFDPRNKAVFCINGVRTDYKGREKSLPSVISILYRTYAAHPGKYIAFFPSYSYLENAVSEFSAAYPDLTIWKQKAGMTEEEKRAWISWFDDEDVQGIGFAVLGGIFSEGIDLRGDKLIGTMIVSVGLPQICIERDLVRDAMEKMGKDGYDYAYMYPGLGRVFQAAGRLIRTETDRGVIVLIDQRYQQARYRKLFPADWNAYYVTEEDLPGQLNAFWKHFETEE